jgi:hypothetical protein
MTLLFSGYVILSLNGSRETNTVSHSEIEAWISVFGNDARKIESAKVAGHRAVEVNVFLALPTN